MTDETTIRILVFDTETTTTDQREYFRRLENNGVDICMCDGGTKLTTTRDNDDIRRHHELMMSHLMEMMNYLLNEEIKLTKEDNRVVEFTIRNRKNQDDYKHIISLLRKVVSHTKCNPDLTTYRILSNHANEPAVLYYNNIISDVIMCTELNENKGPHHGLVTEYKCPSGTNPVPTCDRDPGTDEDGYNLQGCRSPLFESLRIHFYDPITSTWIKLVDIYLNRVRNEYLQMEFPLWNNWR